MAKRGRGRPPKFSSVDGMQEKIDAYFDQCDGTLLQDAEGNPILSKYGETVYINRHPPTITGLALALGFNGRRQMLDYQGKKDFCNTITRAKARVEQYAEERLYDRDGQRGAEFSLRCNFRWRTEEEQDRETAAASGGVVLLPAVMAAPEPPKEPDGEDA